MTARGFRLGSRGLFTEREQGAWRNAPLYTWRIKLTVSPPSPIIIKRHRKAARPELRASG